MARDPAFLASNVLPELADSNEVSTFKERAARSNHILSVRLNRANVSLSRRTDAETNRLAVRTWRVSVLQEGPGVSWVRRSAGESPSRCQEGENSSKGVFEFHLFVERYVVRLSVKIDGLKHYI